MNKENERYHKEVLELSSECQKGKHKLVEINRGWHAMGGSEEVVRWCEVCGSVVVDVDYDNRTNAGQVMKMRGSTITKMLLFLLKKNKKEKKDGSAKT